MLCYDEIATIFFLRKKIESMATKKLLDCQYGNVTVAHLLCTLKPPAVAAVWSLAQAVFEPRLLELRNTVT